MVRTNCTDRKDITPLPNFTSKAENILSVANDMQFTTVNSSLPTVKNFTDRTSCTDRKEIAPLYGFTSKA